MLKACGLDRAAAAHGLGPRLAMVLLVLALGMGWGEEDTRRFRALARGLVLPSRTICSNVVDPLCAHGAPLGSAPACAGSYVSAERICRASTRQEGTFASNNATLASGSSVTLARPPVIAIVANRAARPRLSWSVPESYLGALGRAGAVALIIDPTSGATGIDRSLAAADGVLLVGGLDIDPAVYAATPHPATGTPDAVRDSLDLAVLKGALARGLPLLGVCRGFQIVAVAAGQPLDQHLPDQHLGDRADTAALGSLVEHGPGRADVADAPHAVEVVAGSRLAAAAGLAPGETTLADVASQHHQGIHTAPAGWAATARAADGVIEALEPIDREAPWALAVQWHPERTANDAAGDALFRALVSAATRPS